MLLRQVRLTGVMIVCLWAGATYAIEVSSRPGMGAIPYEGGTTFRVWAPNASTVHVAGQFNGWSATTQPLASEGNGLWSTDVASAVGFQHYRYVINGTIWKTDPRARDVVDSVGNGIIIATDHSWQPFTMPPWNELVIYEMHIGTFNDTPGGSPGTFQSAIARLDHVASLGINAVKVMPVAEFPGDYSLGYNPVNLFAPEGAYGSPADFRAFIDACHLRDIAVLLDVVYNHLGPTDLGQSLWQFDGTSASAETGGIYFYEDDNRSTPWGDTRPNYLTGEVRSFLRDNAMYWLSEYRLDGLRMDGTAFIRERGFGGPDIPEGWSLMQWINNEIGAAFGQKISIAEDMRDNDWITKTTGEGGAGFDSQWDAQFHHKVVAALTTPDDAARNMWEVRDMVSRLFNGWDTQRVIYVENHDEAGQASGKARLPEKIWPGNAASWFSKKRSTLGAGIVLTSPGIPMLFMGQEFLEDGSWHDDTPLDWSKNTTYAGIRQLHCDLISLRRNFGGLTRGLLGKNVNVFHVNDTDKVIAYHRWLDGGAGDDVVVVANFANQGYDSYVLGMPHAGRWRVRFNSDWDGYDPEFGNQGSFDAYAHVEARDGLNYTAGVGLGPYSMIVLSQGTTPDLNGDGRTDLQDFVPLSTQWQNTCDDWNACAGADFDISGSVNVIDLHIFLSDWLE